MLHICFCDDNTTFSKQLIPIIRNTLQEYPIQISYFKSGQSFLFHYLENYNLPDIIIMDIEMDYINGIDVMKKMRSVGCTSELIYLTSIEDYVFDSFDTKPLHYLIKANLDINKLKKVLYIAVKNALEKKQEFIIIEKAKNVFKVLKKEIIYIEANNKLLTLYLMNNNTIQYYGVLSKFLELANTDGFIQIHKSYIINLQNILQIKAQHVILIDKTKLPIGRKYKNTVRSQFADYLTQYTTNTR